VGIAMVVKCDVLVVGAGPAGSSAARSASLNGAKTIFIDKKKEVGNPVQCAEGIGEYLFPYLPFKIPKEQLIWKIDGMFFWVDDISIEKIGDQWKGYSVNRRKFDKWLSEIAVKNGAELWTGTELTEFKFDNDNNVKKAIVKRKEKFFEIFPKVVVAADGCESTVLKLLDLYHPKKGALAEVYSWEMKNINLCKPHLEQLFFGVFSPNAYSYIFPKSKTVANVGVGSIFPEKKMEKYFKEFLEIEHVKKQVKNAEFVVEKSKKAVWNDLTDKWIYGNIVLAGDVANQSLKPFIEGILPSIICGDLSGKIAFDISTKKNLFHKYYQTQVEELFNVNFDNSKNMQEFLNYFITKKGEEKYLQFFGIITELLNPRDLKKIENMDFKELKSLLGAKIK
jgi:digeranylgeranylglycerophospholipid reductase